MSLYRKNLIGLATGLAAVALLAGCDSQTPVASAPPPAEVGVVTVEMSDVPLITELPGRTSAFRKAEVRPQVTGIIEKRLFHEGAEITAGSQLYQIDAASYQAALSRAQAELARGEANFTSAKARETRYQDLATSKAISRQDYDDALAVLGQAKADVAAGKAAVETAAINLKYTQVNAPISGVIGKSEFTEGALVTAGQAQALATIQQLDPIYVDVSQSATDLLQIRRLMLSGNLSAQKAAKVRLLLDDGSIYEHEGELQFAEVGVNESTGSVVLRAIFPNPDRLLLPGMFVRAEIQEGIHANAIAVPQQGIARDRTGNATALIVNADGIVEPRAIKVTRGIGNNWLVQEGLVPGDQLIVEGLQKARPGAPVKAVPAQSFSVTAKE